MSYVEDFLLELQDDISDICDLNDIEFTNDTEFWVNPVDYFIGWRESTLDEIWSKIEDCLEKMHDEAEIEHNMDSEYCELSQHGCEDCYISECCSSACR